MSSSETRSTPVIHWSQSEGEVRFKIDVAEVDSKTLKLTAKQNRVIIEARAKNRPNHVFEIDLECFGAVIPMPKPQVWSHSCLVSFAKSEPGMWPRLLENKSTIIDKNKIKIDWDRWVDEEGEAEAAATAADGSSSSDGPTDPEALRREWESIQANKAKLKDAASRMPTGFEVSFNPELAALPQKERLKYSYLYAYNMFVIVGNFMILLLTVQNCIKHYQPKEATIPNPSSTSETPGSLSSSSGSIHSSAFVNSIAHDGGLENALYYGLSTAHNRVASLIFIIQFLASLEIVHAATGLIPGRVLPSFLLNGGRDIILYGIILFFPASQVDYGTGALYVLWCVGDLIRYLYYLMQLVTSNRTAELVASSWFSEVILMGLKHQPTQKVFMLIRYTLPLFLLPFGFASELRVVYASLPDAENISFLGLSLADVFKGYCLLAYLIGAPYLYLAVLQQRKSKLKAEKKQKSTSSSAASTETKKEK